MRVIGTAGHVDHGKSTLVEALTGIHPDRLKEEREREMTIDLGFAWLRLPDGEEVGIVDVPGHRDFIENMLAGVGGIDAALLVVAADEGVMPQTREHLAILDLLQVRNGLVALTKIDLVQDADWLDLVEDEIRQTLSGTALSEAPIVRVSARTRQGLDLLLAALLRCLENSPPRPDLGRPRLPIDRVFKIAGFGTVVTGTLIDGRLTVGEEIEVLPTGIRGRIRGLQTHKKKEEISLPGSRTAVNISGISTEQVKRGDVLIHPGDYSPTRRIDVRVKILPDASRSLRHNTQLKLFLGAAEVLARARLLGSEELPPGEQGWLQLELAQPVTTVRGDRFVLRYPSPGETFGGGEVIDPHPAGRHKRFSAATLGRFQALAQGDVVEVLRQALLSLGSASLKDVIAASHLETAVAERAAADLLASGEMLILEGSREAAAGTSLSANLSAADLVAGRSYVAGLSQRILEELRNFHRTQPLKKGMPREELKSRLKAPARTFNALLRQLTAAGGLVEDGPLVSLPGFQIEFNPEQQRSVQMLLTRFAESPFAPPSVKECQAEVGEDVYAALVELGRLVQVSGEVVFSREAYEHIVAEVRSLLESQGTITAAQVRDHLNTSRKYALAVLEYLDRQGVTVREGDFRRLRK